MAKQLNVNLAFTADASRAKQVIAELNASLNSISTKRTQIFHDQDLKKASQAAQELQFHLSNAVNVDTGKLNLNKFMASIKQSGSSLNQLQNNLLLAGKQGEQAFINLSRSIATSDSQMLNLGTKMKEFGTTLKNTIKWQISSSMLHNAIGTMQHAIGYAKDLNESLNNIRIVTGANVEQMTKFAEQANKTAKALNTTTTKYTDASLIYYQQGLSDQQVKERTDVTIKMANAAGVSAQTVSDQMTAVWNNFDNGSKSLEYYADVMTALGAATASSTSEISNGLQKFAAIAETVGLSYEYATAALATVTSETRESADVVGTAFKTLFARIQGLSLGETLEDGTDLNKYSQALDKVGISIFEQNGQLKNMDTILNEMGSKWNTLSDDQQMALAQTVAGVRQYTQLMALMENWDTFKLNVAIAEGSEGTLQKQADIFADSIEAALNRVNASSEKIFSQLLPDDLILGFVNGFDVILTALGGLIDGFGGLGGVITFIGSIFMRSFAKEIPAAIAKTTQNFQILTGKAQQQKEAAIEDQIANLNTLQSKYTKGSVRYQEIEGIKAATEMTLDLERKRHLLTDAEVKAYQQKIKNVEMAGRERAEIQKTIELSDKEIAQAKKKAKADTDTEKYKKLKSQMSKKQQAEDRKAQLEAEGVSVPQNKKGKQLNKKQAELKAAQSTINQVDEDIDKLDQKIYTEMQKDVADARAEGKLATGSSLKEEQRYLQDKYLDDYAEQTYKAKLKQGYSANHEKKMDQLDLALAEANNTDNPEAKKAAYAALTEEIKKYKEALAKDVEVDVDVGADLEKIGESANYSEEEVKQLKEALDKLRAAKTDIETATENIDTDVENTENKLNALGVDSDVQFGIVTKAEEKADTELHAKSIPVPKKEELKVDTMPVTAAFGVVAGAAMNVMSIFSSLSMLGQTLFNPAATSTEKFNAVLSATPALLMSTSQLLSTLTSESFIKAGVSIGKLGQKLPFAVKGLANIGAGATGAGGALAGMLSVIGPVIAAIAALAAVIALIDWANVTPEEQLEQARATSEELNTTLQSVKSSAEEVRASFENYNGAIEALKNCTRGTKEWDNALRDVNNLVLELMSKYPQLSLWFNENGEKAITKGKDGEFIVSDWAQQRLIDEKNYAIQTATLAQNTVNKEIKDLNIVIESKDLVSQIEQLSSSKGATDSQGYFAKYLVDNLDKIDSMTRSELTDFVSQYADSHTGAVGNIGAWVDTIQQLGPQIGQLSNEIQSNTNITELENKILAEQLLSDNEIVKNSKRQNEITSITAALLDDKVEQNLKELEHWGKNDISKLDGVNQEARDVFARYANAAGITNYDLLNTTGMDSNRAFVYRDLESNQEVNVTLETMKHVVAAFEAQQESKDQTSELIELFTNKTDEQVGAITALATNSSNYLKLNKGFAFDLEEQDQLKLQELTGSTMEELNAQYAALMEQNIINAQNLVADQTSAIQEILSLGKTEFDIDDYSELSYEQFSTYVDTLNTVFATQGTEGLNTISEAFKKANESGQASDFIDLISNMSWDTAGIETLRSNLATLFNQSADSDYINNIVTALENVASATSPTVASLYELAEAIKNLVTGDVVSDEIYKSVIEAGLDPNEYFMDTLLGPVLKVAPEVLSMAVEDKTSQGFSNESTELQSQAALIQSVIDWTKGPAFSAAVQARAQSQEAIERQSQLNTLRQARIEAQTNLNQAEQNKQYWDTINQFQGQYKSSADDGENIVGQALAQLRSLGINTDMDTVIKSLSLSADDFRSSYTSAGTSLIEAQARFNKTSQDLTTAESSITETDQALLDTQNNYNKQLVPQFLDLLEATGSMDQSQIDAYRAVGDKLTQTEVNTIADAAYGVIESLGGVEGVERELGVKLENTNSELIKVNNTEAINAKDLQNLHQMQDNGEITQQQYDDAFETVYQKEVKDLGFDLEEVNNYAKHLQEVNKELAKYDNLAKELALHQLRINRGINSLTKDSNKLINTIKNYNKQTEHSIEEQLEYSNALEGTRDAYKDIFQDIDPKLIDQLSEQFLSSEKNLKLLEEGLNGNKDAWNEWESNVLQEITRLDPVFKDVSSEMRTQMNNVLDMAANLDFTDIEIGAKINDTDFVNGLESLKFQSHEAAQAMSDALSNVGVDAEVVETKVEVPGSTSRTIQNGSITKVNSNGDKTIEEVNGEIYITTDPHTETYYTLQGAKYNGKGVTGGGGGGSKGGGGGGGGGKKPKKAKEVKKTDVVNRYKETTDKIDDITEAFEDASEAADRMYGNDRIKQIEKVNKLLKEEIALMKEKKDEALKYLQEDLNNLQQAASEAGVSFAFDEAGNIINYTEQMTKLFNELDSAIKSANADGDANEDEQENIDKIQEKVDKVKEMIEQYDETKELIEDISNDIQEKLYEIYDKELEAFEYKVELDLEISEDSMEIIEFQLSQIEDDAFKAAESIALTSQKAENLYDTLMTNRNALDEAFSLSDIAWDLGIMTEGQEFTEEQIDLMKEYRDNIMDVIEEMSELRETVEEQVMEVFETWNDKLETNMETLDHFGSMLDSYKNIVDIVGQDTMGLSEGFMQGIQEASVEHALDQMHATKEAYETMMSARLRAEQALEDARARGDDASAKMWEETLTELNSNMESAQEDMLSSWEDALSVIQDNFEATVERVVETFNNAVYAFGGMEGLSNEFSRQKEMADLMVDDYQKIYELSKLNRNIQKTLDDTDVIAGKQKLLKLQEKINALEEEGVELSQYDLEYLQAEYELRMAEIELENAQAKKDTVRLSKDNEGNWSYIYTTSMDAVDEAHQKYEDALYAMQELSSNYVDEMSEQLISTSQEMAEALAEVRASDFASQEDYEKELDRIRQLYQERLDQQEFELQKSIDNNKELYTQDWTNYHEATRYKISDTENFVTSFKDTLLGALMDSESDTANFNNIMSSSVDILTTGLVDAAATYYSHMEQAMQAAGTSTNDFAVDMQENIDTVVQKSEEGAAAIEDMAEKMASAFWDISDSVNQWQEGYGSAMQQVIDSNLAVVESFNNMLKELSIDPDSIKVEYDISTDYGLENASSMDTGGYTGTWGTAGKLAILHEKELVLNPDDTSNFLQAIGISKTLLETIDLNARQASNGMGILSAAGFRDSNNGTLEQNVHIEATFPNVTDHNEIEEAVKNLVNTASQYANRK